MRLLHLGNLWPSLSTKLVITVYKVRIESMRLWWWNSQRKVLSCLDCSLCFNTYLAWVFWSNAFSLVFFFLSISLLVTYMFVWNVDDHNSVVRVVLVVGPKRLALSVVEQVSIYLDSFFFLSILTNVITPKLILDSFRFHRCMFDEYSGVNKRFGGCFAVKLATSSYTARFTGSKSSSASQSSLWSWLAFFQISALVLVLVNQAEISTSPFCSVRFDA